MKSYTHFTLDERICLQKLFSEGLSMRKIASILGRSPSTISREIKRNWSKKKKHYHAWGANVKYICRRKNSHRKIYRAVRTGQFPGIKPNTHFRRKAKPYNSEKKSYTRFIENSIHDRPIDINNRARLGDFEGDKIYGSVGKGYLVTAIDRCSRLLVAAKCEDKTIPVINNAFSTAFSKVSELIQPITLTLDNGSEFNGFKEIERENHLKVYFADPHSPWQRGSNENINGLLRFFFPRGTDFRKLSQEQLDSVVSLINNRPRKCLGYLSPIEFIKKYKNMLHLA